MDIREKIIACRNILRAHRDQKGDDRCWVDDYAVWGLIAGSPGVPQAPPPFHEAMRLCTEFHRCRNAAAPDAAPGIIADRARWDDDLTDMDAPRLEQELARIEQAAARHRDIAGRPRTAEDDRALYAVLPEKIPADFRLPPEDAFLGEALAPHAGCPSFWRSHAACPAMPHNLHRWGPCGK